MGDGRLSSPFLPSRVVAYTAPAAGVASSASSAANVSVFVVSVVVVIVVSWAFTMMAKARASTAAEGMMTVLYLGVRSQPTATNLWLSCFLVVGEARRRQAGKGGGGGKRGEGGCSRSVSFVCLSRCWNRD